LKDKKLWKELICLPSLDGHPTKEVLAHTRIGVFFILSVADTIFTILFIPKPPEGLCGRPVVRELQFEKHCSTDINFEAKCYFT
jgi:hypothetical protein